MTRGRLYVGTCGYQYDHWQGVFYPEGLRKKDRFAYYAERFAAIELNSTFYNLPKPETFDAWAEAAPAGFLYCLKYSRYGSHLKRLKDPDKHVPTFTECAARLGEHLGPVLVQLPGNMKADPKRLDAFFATWPRGYRLAVEVRHESWLDEAVYTVLRAHDAALVAHDMQPDMLGVPATAGFAYLRFHGPTGDYTGNYSSQFLSARADAVAAELDAGRDVFAAFNNGADGHAPANAQQLARDVRER